MKRWTIKSSEALTLNGCFRHFDRGEQEANIVIEEPAAKKAIGSPQCRLEQPPAKTRLWKPSGRVNREEVFFLKFAAARPSDHGFLEPREFLDLHNSAFSGIPEWDVFAEHVSECSRCGAV